MTAVHRTLYFAAAFILLVMTASVFSSCSASKGEEVLTSEGEFARAMKDFDNENYLDAIEAFKTITVQYQGSSIADAAQFYIGEARFNRGEYILAAAEYDMLIRSMPSSKYVSRARYKRALSYYEMSPKPELDQKYTRLAIDDFQTFLEYAPKDSLAREAEQHINELTNKLAEKIFESGTLYYRREFYKAAIVYFDNVIDQYHDTRYADAAMLWKAKAQRERKEYDAALKTIDELVDKYPATSFKDDAAALRRDVEAQKAQVPDSDVRRKADGTL
ncbi:MAG TPA: outer membrane protein assembly factor BamD [Bacteroidota bacterium]|nr:outer membrane protein assembly factor BamD [Bacteroidota bacterium]